MIGGLHGNWALVLLVYAGLLVLATGSHVVWVRRNALYLWRSGHNTTYKFALTLLLIVTPIVGFYALRMSRPARAPLDKARLHIQNLNMPAVGALAVLTCAVAQTLRYSPDFRTWSTLLGTIPGFLAFYLVMQSILFMAASVFGLSQRGFLTSRTHLFSAAIVLATGVCV
jgi:hypothetical protein